MHVLQELVRLHRMGVGSREVARKLNLSPNTERGWRRAFDAAGLLKGPVENLPELDQLEAALPAQVPPQQRSSLEDHVERVRELMKNGSKPRAIYDRLRIEEGDGVGSYWAMKRLYRRLRKAEGVRPEDVAIPVETSPGEVAQVDFGYAGMVFDPVTQRLRKAWVFVMVLCFSRHLFAKVVFDQRAETWQQLHVEAFHWFGGVPAVLVPDNLKAAVVRAAFGPSDDPGLQRGYREVARHYGFQIDPTPPYAPEKKGKVEAAVKYVKNNFFATLPEGTDATEVNLGLRKWAVEIAGRRIHGTTRRQPLEVFLAEEKETLRPLPAQVFRPVTWKDAKVHRDSHVAFDGALYSVPFKLIGQTVTVRATTEAVTVYAGTDRVADHGRLGAGRRSTKESHLPEQRADLRHRGRGFWEGRAAALGPETASLVGEMFDDPDVLLPLRKVQAVVTHLETFPRERAERAARRARHFAIHDYRGIKEILRKAIEGEPLPQSLFPEDRKLTRPRFNRPVAEMLAGKKEESHECN